MKIKHYIALAALTMPLAASAQSVIDFETSDTQGSALGVYDTWENSPFRTGALKGNVKVIDNPHKEVDDITQEGNISDKVLAFQRSRFGSNTFGVKVSLASPLALDATVKYVHVKLYTPKSRRSSLAVERRGTGRGFMRIYSEDQQVVRRRICYQLRSWCQHS